MKSTMTGSRRSNRILLLLPVFVLFTACNSSTAPSKIETDFEPVTVAFGASSYYVSPSSPVKLEITITNHGEEEVVWGHGSSHCKAEFMLRKDGGVFALRARVCTADLVPYRLDPGESEVFEMEWEGTAVIDGDLIELSPGVHEVFGIAGDYESEPVRIQLRSWP